MNKCMDDCNYNCTKQLSKKLSFLWNVDQYIKDAKECGHKECAEIFKKIKEDEQKHADMLKKLIIEKVKKRRF
ncbi:hypothetical protein HYT57_05775 [Candidatus Woesearchaeota archaeon]|nr:hypothetical protein [Candidatus Woesearchaeota archaeon]